MKVYLFRGNPIAIILSSSVLSIVSIILLISSFIGKHILQPEIYLFLAFSILFSSGISVVFYLAYRKSEYSFMSPKKYKKALLIYEKNKELKEVLVQIDSKNNEISPDKTIDKAIELLREYK